MLVLSSFYAYRISGLVIALLNMTLWLAAFRAAPRTRLRLMVLRHAERVLDQLERRAWWLASAQVCLLIFHAVSCLDRRTSFLLSSAMAHWRTAITHAPAELCMPSVRNKSYVYAHCPHAAKLASPLDLIVHGSADLLARSAATSGCVDGGYGGYPSLLDACVAAMNMQVQLPRNHAILTLQAQLCFRFVQEVWGVLHSGRIIRRLRSVIAYVVYLMAVLHVAVLLQPHTISVLHELIASHVFLATTYVLFLMQVLLSVVPLLRRLQRQLVHRSTERYDLFLSHAWGWDAVGRDNHERASRSGSTRRRCTTTSPTR